MINEGGHVLATIREEIIIIIGEADDIDKGLIS